jgi:hypothetical protein
MNCIRVLDLLSRSAAFAKPFVFLGGHETIATLLQL